MVKSVLVIVLFGLIAVSYVSAVSKCFVCDDCENPENEKTCAKEGFPQREDDTSKKNTPVSSDEDNKDETTTPAPVKEFNCFKVLTKTDGKTKVQRGCTEHTTCENVNIGKAEEVSCIICDENCCNSASNIYRLTMGVIFFIASTMALL